MLIKWECRVGDDPGAARSPDGAGFAVACLFANM